MTLPSSCAPLTGISRARLPAWALPDGWPTQANGEPLLADLAFRDGRIAALTPTDQPTPGLWDLAGALTLPGLVEPHAHLDKTFTIERCRPAQAGLLPAIHAMHEDRQHWSRADIQRRASTALARAAANGVTHLRSHIDWFTADAPDAWQEIARLDTGGITLERVALVPLPLFREPAQAEAIARAVANSGERCLLGGFIHSSNWDAAAMENLLCSAARWDLDLDLHIDEELSEVSQGLTWLADHLSRHPFSRTYLLQPRLRAGRRQRRTGGADPAPAGGARRHPYRSADDQPAAAGCDVRPHAAPAGITLLHEAQAAGVATLLGCDNVQDAFCPAGEL